MIHLADATTLALTKLRTRKIRLIVTIIISGLLFSGLAGVSMILRGAMGSMERFGEEGLGSRFIASGNAEPSFSYFNDDTVNDRAVAIHKETVARKKAEAKRLGLEYDAAADVSPVQEYSDPGGGKYKNLNPDHPAARQAILEKINAKARPGKTEFEQMGKKYNVLGIYASKRVTSNLGGGTLQVLTGGKEEYTRKAQQGLPTGTESFVSSWEAMDRELLEPFILPGQNLKRGSDGSIPMIVPKGAAEKILQLKALPESATSEDRLARIKEIREKAPSISFQVCYRNQGSAELVYSALNTAQEIETNKNKKDYQKPDLIYGLPAAPCGTSPVTRDVRTAADKALAAKQQEFDRTFGAEAPEQATFTFRIVGIVPDLNFDQAFGVSQIIRSLVTSSLGSGWYMPYEELKSDPTIDAIFNKVDLFSPGETYYAEFATADQTRKFIDKETCQVDYSKLDGTKDPGTLCVEQGHPFNIGPYGSNSLALDGAKKGFSKVFRIAALIVSGIAAIIMMGIVGRMIADSRRETAVFRAIGAKRLDIAQIYVLYAVFLSLLIAAFAIVVGGIGAAVVNHIWSPEATVAAVTAFNAKDLTQTFPLYGFYWPDMLMIIGLAVAAGLVSSSLPLIRNVRRNPIRDMRDEG